MNAENAAHSVVVGEKIMWSSQIDVDRSSRIVGSVDSGHHSFIRLRDIRMSAPAGKGPNSWGMLDKRRIDQGSDMNATRLSQALERCKALMRGVMLRVRREKQERVDYALRH